MDKQPFFSIIVPAYNVENYIEECLDSILKQDCKDYEIIIVDDGSKDGTGKICDKYKEKYEALCVFHQENQGLSGARNTGIENSSGKYLLFVDSDDRIAENSLGLLRKYILDNNCNFEVVVMRRMTINPKNGNLEECKYRFDVERYKSMHIADIYAELDTYSDCWLGPWLFCCQKNYIWNNQFYFYPGILHEDEEWVPRILFNSINVGFWNGVLYCNRIERAASITATLNIKRLFDRLKIVELLEKDFPCEKYEKKIIDAVQLRRCKLVFGVLCDCAMYRGDQNYKCLINEINNRIMVLKYSPKRTHRMTYYCTRVFKITCVSDFLGYVKKKGKCV